jgi:hypothetical protein
MTAAITLLPIFWVANAITTPAIAPTLMPKVALDGYLGVKKPGFRSKPATLSDQISHPLTEAALDNTMA